MLSRRHLRRALVVTFSLAVGAGCASKVLAPPRVDLGEYGVVGMLAFDGRPDPQLGAVSAQVLLQEIQACQPGARVIELGDEARVLGDVGHETLDFQAVRAIGEKYGVDAIFTGQLDVTEVVPKLSVSRSLMSMSVSGDVEATLSARLLETGSGATVWTRSLRGQQPVAQATVVKRGPVDFGADDPDSATARLIRNLAYGVADDFRSHWVRE